MTVYNGEKYIFEAVQSILNQTFQEFELIIIDDGSTDQTKKIIKEIIDKRISLHSLPVNMGVGYANNFAIQFAKGKYIAKMDADDIATPDRLAIQYKFLKENPDVDVVDSFIDYFTEIEEVRKSERYQFVKNTYENHVNKHYESDNLSKELYWFCNIVHSAVMYNKKLVDHFRYPTDMRVCEDYSYFYQMNKKNVVFNKIPEMLLSVRLTATSITATHSEELLLNVLRIKKVEIHRLIKRDKKPFAIWGSGKLAEITYKYIKENLEVENSIFIDSKIKKESKLFGVDVLSSNQVNLTEFKVFIASSYGKFEIVERVEKNGLKHLEDYLVIY